MNRSSWEFVERKKGRGELPFRSLGYVRKIFKELGLAAY